MSTATTYLVEGMTCGHCVAAVSGGLREIPGVDEVSIELVAEGTSRVRVASNDALSESSVSAAIDEAGGYRLVGVAA